MNNITPTERLIEAQHIMPPGGNAPMSASIYSHDTLCLIGPDTARLYLYLRTLAGIEPPLTGELKLFGTPLRDVDKRGWREQRQRMGYVACNAPILSVLSGLENVMLPALYHNRMTRDEAQEKAKRLIAATGCSADIHTLPAYLTTQQRLQMAIARATILEPEILFVESPFSGLSLIEQLPLYRYLKSWAADRPLAIATHNLRLVREQATQILFIGQQQVLNFDSWQTLNDSQHEEVCDYMEQYQQQFKMAE